MLQRWAKALRLQVKASHNLLPKSCDVLFSCNIFPLVVLQCETDGDTEEGREISVEVKLGKEEGDAGKS